MENCDEYIWFYYTIHFVHPTNTIIVNNCLSYPVRDMFIVPVITYTIVKTDHHTIATNLSAISICHEAYTLF